MEAAPKPRRVVKAPAVRREELIDCAQRLFLAQGYEKTTINEVIAATGLSKGAFYHHFRSKEDLLAAVNYMDRVVRTISTPEKRLTKKKNK